MRHARSASPVWHLPVYSFDGDESCSLLDYERAVYAGYVSSVSTLCGAAEAYDVSIDDETFERWKRCASAAGLIDNYLDSSEDISSTNNIYQKQLYRIASGSASIVIPKTGRLNNPLLTSIQLLHNSTKSLPESRRQTLAEAASQIGTLAIQKAESSDVYDYQGLLLSEAVNTSALTRETVSEKVHNNRNFKSFMGWCTQALIFATIADSTRDIASDYKSGRTKVYPSVQTRLTLLNSTRKQSRVLYSGSSARAATTAALRARAKFSKLPTKHALAHNIL